MDELSVSVVIPVFRRPATVQEAIRSALAQTHPVLEIIVVDDASGDGTADAVRAIADPRVKLITLVENQGQSAATNIGIDAAGGDLVALLDSDDIWLPEKLACQIAVWQALPDRGRKLVAARVIVEVNGQATGVAPERALRPGEAIDDFLFVRDGLVQSSTLLVPHALAAEVRFDSTMRRHSDLGFLLRLTHAGGSVVQMDEPLARWRSVTGAARLSTTAKLDSSLEWYRKYRPMMSRRAAIAFRYRNHIRILRRYDKKAAAVVTLQAIGAGVLGWREVRRALAAAKRRIVPESAPR